jgi:hypothetical protein
MSPYAKGRRWSPPLLVLALLASLFGLIPAAHATTSTIDKYLEFSYPCLKGQTLSVTPGQVQVETMNPEGRITGLADIESAELWIWPREPYTEDGVRHQVDPDPGEITHFQTEVGLPVNDRKTIGLHYSVKWTGEGEPRGSYGMAYIECTGQASDTDGDGVLDETDACPNEAAPESPDGCPSGVSLHVVNVQNGDTTKGVPGTATIGVTNLVDGRGQEQYRVWYGDQEQTLVLGDGDYSDVTFTGSPGDWNVCAKGSTRQVSSCITATVPDYVDPYAGYGGTVTYVQTCTGLRYTIANTGNEPLTASMELASLGTRGSTTQWTLSPGATRTATTPLYFNATVSPTLYSSDRTWKQVLASKRWVHPGTCSVPMTGGTKLVRWGPRIVRDGMPRAIVSTKAHHALVGYQVKGRSRIHWVSDYDTQGRHRFGNFLRLNRGKKVTLRLWVVYVDENYMRAGKAVFTRWHTFRRP